jgi:hypothetical protein
MKLILFFAGLIIIQSTFSQQIVNEKKLRIKDRKAYLGSTLFTGSAYGDGYTHYYKNGLREGEFRKSYFSVQYRANRALLFKYFGTNDAVIYTLNIDSIHNDAYDVKFSLVCNGEKNDTLKLTSSALLQPALIIQYGTNKTDTIYLKSFTFKGYSLEISLKKFNRNLFSQNNNISPEFVGKNVQDVWCFIIPSDSKFKNTDIEMPEKSLFLSK